MSEQQPRSPLNLYKGIIVGLVVVIVVLIGIIAQGERGRGGPAAVPNPGATVTVTAGAQPPAPGEQPSPQPPSADELDFFLKKLPKRDPADPLAVGKPDARIVMTEWADYRCPFCSIFAEDTKPHLQKYLDDGTLRIEFRDLAIFGEESVKAATAARAAGAQGRYFDFQHALFVALPNEGHPDIEDDVVLGIVDQLGLDRAQFEKDWKDPATRKAVMADSAEAQQLGVSSTPSFLIGAQFMAGAQPLAEFERVIEQQAQLHG